MKRIGVSWLLDSEFKGFSPHADCKGTFDAYVSFFCGVVFYPEVFDPLGVYSDYFFPFRPSSELMGFSLFPRFCIYSFYQSYICTQQSHKGLRVQFKLPHPVSEAIDSCISHRGK